MKPTRSAVTACLTLLAIGTPAVAQDLSEVCPGAEAGTGALWGLLSEADAQMALPGATVIASWTLDGDKMIACLGAPDSEFRFRVADLVHCDPRWPGLENCPREELGRVSVTATGGGSRGGRFYGEDIERLIAEAERLGANALVNYEAGGGLIAAKAVFIEVDPASC